MAQKRRSKKEWAEICGAYSASGETAREFAGRHGLKRSTLLWWVSRLRRQQDKSDAPHGFVEVVTVKPQSSSPSVVVRVGEVSVEFGQELPPAQWVAELATRC